MSISLTEQLGDLCRQSTLQQYEKGEVIVRTDSTPPGIFLIKEGYVKVYALTEGGDENLHIVYGPEALFPLTWAITGKLPRQIFYRAIDDVTVFRINQEDFRKFLKDHPEANEVVLQKVVEMFGAYADRVENLEQTRSRNRVVYRLLRLGETFGEVCPEGILIKVPVKHHDIANSINCSRETVSRELEVLRKKGLIASQDHFFIITDREGLERELLQS